MPRRSPKSPGRYAGALVALLLGGCAGVDSERRAEPAVVVSGQSLLAEMARRREAVETLTASARVDATGEEGKVKGRLLLATVDPESVRMDVMSFFDQPISTLVSDGRRFALYDVGEKTYYYGPATPKNLARLLPIPLAPREVVALLMGTVIPAERVRPLLREARGGRWGVLLRGGAMPRGSRVALTFEGSTGDLVRAAWYDRRGLRLAAELGEYKAVEDEAGAAKVRVPHKLQLKLPRSELSATIGYREVYLNEEIEAESFTLEPPRGVKRRYLPGR